MGDNHGFSFIFLFESDRYEKKKCDRDNVARMLLKQGYTGFMS